MRASLDTYKPHKTSLRCYSVEDFFKSKWAELLNHAYSSKSVQDEVASNILYDINDEDLLMTKSDVLKIFFEAQGSGGDGTFNIIPQFVREGTRYRRLTIHKQVYILALLLCYPYIYVFLSTPCIKRIYSQVIIYYPYIYNISNMLIIQLHLFRFSKLEHFTDTQQVQHQSQNHI